MKRQSIRFYDAHPGIAGLRDEGDAVERVTCFLTLNAYKAERPGDPLPEPGEWLAGQWQARNPDLPSLDDLLAEAPVARRVG